MKQNFLGQFVFKDGPTFSMRYRDRADWDPYHEQSDEKMVYNSVEGRIGQPIEINKDLEQSETNTTSNLHRLELEGVEKETIDKHIRSLENFFGNVSKKIEDQIRLKGKGQFNAQEVMNDLGNPKYANLIEEVAASIHDDELNRNLDLIGNNEAIQKELAAKTPTWNAHTAMGLGFIAATTFVYARSFEGRENETTNNLKWAVVLPLIATNGLGYGPQVNGKPVVRNILESGGRLSYEVLKSYGTFGFTIVDFLKGESDASIGQTFKDMAQNYLNAATEPWGKHWELSPEKYGQTPEQIFWKRVEIFSEKGPTQTREFFAFIAEHHDKQYADLSPQQLEQLHEATKGAVRFMLETEVNRDQLQVTSENDPAMREKDLMKQTRDVIDAAISTNPAIFRQAYLELISQKNQDPTLEDLKWDQSVAKEFQEKVGPEMAHELMEEYSYSLEKTGHHHTTIIKPSESPLGGYNGVEMGAGMLLGFRFLAGLAVSAVKNMRGEGLIGGGIKKMKEKNKERKEKSLSKVPSGETWSSTSNLRNLINKGTKERNKDKPQKAEVEKIIDEMANTGAISQVQAEKIKKVYNSDDRRKTFWKNLSEPVKDDDGNPTSETNAHKLMTQTTKHAAASTFFAIMTTSETSGASEKTEIQDIQTETNLYWELRDKSQQLRNDLRRDKPNTSALDFKLKDPLTDGQDVVKLTNITPHKVRRSGSMKIKGEINGKERILEVQEENGIPFIRFKDKVGKMSNWLELEAISGIG